MTLKRTREVALGSAKGGLGKLPRPVLVESFPGISPPFLGIPVHPSTYTTATAHHPAMTPTLPTVSFNTFTGFNGEDTSHKSH